MTPELVEAMEHKVMETVGAETEPTLETSAGELVSLTMDSRFRVTQVTIRGVGLDSQQLAPLEQATHSCVNSAVEQVARRNGERLAETFRDMSAPS